VKTQELEIDFTPMIDVTFLLLIFFMVTASLAQPTEVRLPRAKSGKGEIADNKLMVHIRVGDEANKELRLGSDEAAPVPLSMLAASMSAYPSATEAMLRADADVPFAYVNEVARAIRKAGLPKVLLAVKEREFISR